MAATQSHGRHSSRRPAAGILDLSPSRYLASLARRTRSATEPACPTPLLLSLQNHIRGVLAVELALHFVPRKLEIACDPRRVDQVHVVAAQHHRDRA